MAGKRKQSNGGNARQPKSKAAKADVQKAAKPEYVQKIVTWFLDGLRSCVANLRIADTVIPAGGPDRYLPKKYNTEAAEGRYQSKLSC